MKNILINIKKISLEEFGEYCFYFGTVLLSTTLLISAIFYIISLIVSFLKKPLKIKGDFYNTALFFCTIMMIWSTINSIFTNNHSELLTWDKNIAFLNLFNWIPLFAFFSGSQFYLKNKIQRINFAKCIFVGIIPVIFSCILHKWFIFNGPYEYLYGLVVFYLKPIVGYSGVAGLFPNPNYLGIWLSASLPFSIFILNINKIKRFNLIFVSLIIFSSIYFIILSNSRNSFIGIFIAASIMTSIKFILFLLFTFSMIYIISSGILPIPFIDNLLNKDIVPIQVFKKLFETNYINRYQFPRIDIWEKTLKLISQRPFLGWGAGTFALLYLSRNGMFDVTHTHSMPLEIAQIYGIPSALLITFFVLFILIKSHKIIFNKFQISDNLINKAWLASILTLIISQLTDITYYEGKISFLIWLLLAGLRCIILESEVNDYKES